MAVEVNIELSTFSQRVQITVTRNVQNKKRMIVDYSQIVNWFTFLDA